jgi:hypothetical protein
LAWTAHYNGDGELSKRTAIAKAKLDNLHYRSEQSFTFENCTEVMMKCFNTLHKDPDQRYSDRQKVEKLLKALRCTDAELVAAKVQIDQQYPRDFVQACAYFSQQVARVHAPAQLANRQNRSNKRGIYAIDQHTGRGARGRGRYGGRGGRGGRGRHTGGRAGRQNNINGVNITDPHRSFTSTEWGTLGPNGHTTVMSMRDRTHGSGGRNGGGRGNVRFQDDANERTISSTELVEYNADDAQSGNQHDDTLTDRGGRNGRGFGRGAYGRQGGRS